MLQILVQDVGRIRPDVWPEVFARRLLRELGEVLGQFPARVAPGEVGVRLREAELRQPVHHAGTGERLREENQLGMLGFQLRDAPLPEGKGLGVRVVDPEDRHAVADPELEDALQLGPEAARVFAFKVEWINVLVLLRRVLGVLHRAVGPLLEPRRMLAHIGMVGRALECDVQRDRNAAAARLGHQRVEVGEGAKLRLQGLVPALLCADRPRAADVVGLGS